MKNMYIKAQAQMILPILLKQAQAIYNAIESLKLAQPIGDGVREMVVGKLMLGKENV